MLDVFFRCFFLISYKFNYLNETIYSFNYSLSDSFRKLIFAIPIIRTFPDVVCVIYSFLQVLIKDVLLQTLIDGNR